jgi:hypothetical protein
LKAVDISELENKIKETSDVERKKDIIYKAFKSPASLQDKIRILKTAYNETGDFYEQILLFIFTLKLAGDREEKREIVRITRGETSNIIDALKRQNRIEFIISIKAQEEWERRTGTGLSMDVGTENVINEIILRIKEAKTIGEKYNAVMEELKPITKKEDRLNIILKIKPVLMEEILKDKIYRILDDEGIKEFKLSSLLKILDFKKSIAGEMNLLKSINDFKLLEPLTADIEATMKYKEMQIEEINGNTDDRDKLLPGTSDEVRQNLQKMNCIEEKLLYLERIKSRYQGHSLETQIDNMILGLHEEELVDIEDNQKIIRIFTNIASERILKEQRRLVDDCRENGDTPEIKKQIDIIAGDIGERIRIENQKEDLRLDRNISDLITDIKKTTDKGERIRLINAKLKETDNTEYQVKLYLKLSEKFIDLGKESAEIMDNYVKPRGGIKLSVILKSLDALDSYKAKKTYLEGIRELKKYSGLRSRIDLMIQNYEQELQQNTDMESVFERMQEYRTMKGKTDFLNEMLANASFAHLRARIGLIIGNFQKEMEISESQLNVDLEKIRILENKIESLRSCLADEKYGKLFAKINDAIGHLKARIRQEENKAVEMKDILAIAETKKTPKEKRDFLEEKMKDDRYSYLMPQLQMSLQEQETETSVDESMEQIRNQLKMMSSFDEKKEFLQAKMGSKEFRLFRPKISQLILDIENEEKEIFKGMLLQEITTSLEKIPDPESQRQYLFEKIRDLKYKPVRNQIREILSQIFV